MIQIFPKTYRASPHIFLAWFLMMLGILFRAQQFFLNRSLWGDEASLALNIMERSFVDLLKPLDYAQGGPLGFLMVEKVLVSLWGSSEYVLRFFPFLCGVLSVFLFYKVALRYIAPRAVPIALGFFSFSGWLTYYSSEAKQYSGDVLFTLILLWVAAKIYAEALSVSRVIGYGLVGGISVFFSHPAVFVLVGSAISLALDFLCRKDREKLGKLGVICGIWLLGGGLCFWASYGYLLGLRNSQYLADFWDRGFIHFPLNLSWLRKYLLSVFRDPAGLCPEWLGLIIFVGGGISLWRDKRGLLYVLLISIVVTLFASAGHIYPFVTRLLLFMIPIILLLVAEGIEMIVFRVRPFFRIIGVALSLALLLYSMKMAWPLAKPPHSQEEMRPVAVYIFKHKRPGDMLCLYSNAGRTYLYYMKRGYFDIEDTIRGRLPVAGRKRDLADFDRLRGHRRVWVLFDQAMMLKERKENLGLLKHLDTIGVRKRTYKAVGVAVYLYDFSLRKVEARSL
ncbi:MAG: glycosyltransferase family 39 protein [Candidatus Omnitrophica bacterium]|nr:glycosyltransferase family 39 protein [Candidatus Omnitrophota bacterium]